MLCDFTCKWSRSVISDSLRPHGLLPTRLLCPWNFPGKDTGVGCHVLLQEIFATQGLNTSLLHCRKTLYCLSHMWNLKKKQNKEMKWNKIHSYRVQIGSCQRRQELEVGKTGGKVKTILGGLKTSPLGGL